MKKTLLSVAFLIGLLPLVTIKAQTFTLTADTIRQSVNGSASVYNRITNTTSPSGLTLRWRVIDTDFPTDWLQGLGICDNNVCIYNMGDTALWDASKLKGNSYGTAPYTYGSPGTFDLVLSFETVSLGTHWLTVAVTDPVATYTKNATFVITKAPTSVSHISASKYKVSLFPNPVNTKLNIIFDAVDNVSNIVLHNVMGDVIGEYKISGSNSIINVADIPLGTYYLKIFNKNGEFITARNFTKI